MPRTTDPSKYPDTYWTLLQRAATAPVVIPDPKPAGLRAHIQSFFKAVETLGPEHPNAVLAKSLQVTVQKPPADPAVIVQRRDDSVYARRVAAAIGAAGPRFE